MTNYEKLMAEMTPEKMANILDRERRCPFIGRLGSKCLTDNCPDCILDWLKQEAE